MFSMAMLLLHPFGPCGEVEKCSYPFYRWGRYFWQTGECS